MTKISTFICMLSFVAIQAQTSIFDSLLQKNVDKTGRVDYQSLKNNETLLDNYLAYNAYTIKIILNNYPLKSIRDIKIDGKTAWKIPFVKVGQKRYTLDQIEHEILRKKFNDPRIHVGINCASVSCPRLWNFAFTEDNIASSLDNLMKEFINDTTRNKISKKNVALSEIFNWFSKDFIKNGTIINYLNTYAAIKISEKASIKYLTYDWSLNKK